MRNNEQDLQLDLLVDDELPETQRAALLSNLGPQGWRELAIRFLQRQVEHKSVRQLVSPPMAEPAPALPFPRQQWRLWRIAAALIVSAGAVGLLAYGLRGGGGSSSNVASTPGNSGPVAVALPASVLGTKDPGVRLNVPVLASANGVSSEMFIPSERSETPTRRTLVIMPSDRDSAVVVPVNRVTGVSVQ